MPVRTHISASVVDAELRERIPASSRAKSRAKPTDSESIACVHTECIRVVSASDGLPFSIACAADSCQLAGKSDASIDSRRVTVCTRRTRNDSAMPRSITAVVFDERYTCSQILVSPAIKASSNTSAVNASRGSTSIDDIVSSLISMQASAYRARRWNSDGDTVLTLECIGTIGS